MIERLTLCFTAQVPTTIDYHQLILDTADFRAGNVDTGFIPNHAEELAKPPTSGKLVGPIMQKISFIGPIIVLPRVCECCLVCSRVLLHAFYACRTYGNHMPQCRAVQGTLTDITT